MHNLSVPSFLFTNSTGVSEDDTLGLVCHLSNISFNCNFNSTNVRVLMQYITFDTSDYSSNKLP